jgi:hypothetical protein
MAIDNGVDIGTIIDNLRGRRSDDDDYIHDRGGMMATTSLRSKPNSKPRSKSLIKLRRKIIRHVNIAHSLRVS